LVVGAHVCIGVNVLVGTDEVHAGDGVSRVDHPKENVKTSLGYVGVIDKHQVPARSSSQVFFDDDARQMKVADTEKIDVIVMRIRRVSLF
jgi:hypothetical protein